ncbi:putative signal peptide protein [Puccinia sorghi]|uniref:Putative signal peptide protein n=1 Tax=Puccinia sorghi TaxID=27349 RepID=A0A0L6V867_9BASI|nr:putative signal peptide protein [Puccinia sorghi]
MFWHSHCAVCTIVHQILVESLWEKQVFFVVNYVLISPSCIEMIKLNVEYQFLQEPKQRLAFQQQGLLLSWWSGRPKSAEKSEVVTSDFSLSFPNEKYDFRLPFQPIGICVLISISFIELLLTSKLSNMDGPEHTRRTSRWKKNNNINSDSDSAHKTPLAKKIQGENKTKVQSRFQSTQSPETIPNPLHHFPGNMRTEQHLTQQDGRGSQIGQPTLTSGNQDDRSTPFDGSATPEHLCIPRTQDYLFYSTVYPTPPHLPDIPQIRSLVPLFCHHNRFVTNNRVRNSNIIVTPVYLISPFPPFPFLSVTTTPQYNILIELDISASLIAFWLGSTLFFIRMTQRMTDTLAGSPDIPVPHFLKLCFLRRRPIKNKGSHRCRFPNRHFNPSPQNIILPLPNIKFSCLIYISYFSLLVANIQFSSATITSKLGPQLKVMETMSPFHSLKIILIMKFSIFFYPCTPNEMYLIAKLNNIQFEAHPVLIKQNSVNIFNLRPEPTRTTQSPVYQDPPILGCFNTHQCHQILPLSHIPSNLLLLFTYVPMIGSLNHSTTNHLFSLLCV